MRILSLLILPLIFMLVAGCSGIPDSDNDDMLAILPYPQQIKKTGGFFDPEADGLTGRISGIGRMTEPVIFTQLAELSIDLYFDPGEKQADPDFWIGIPAVDPAFLSYCEKADQEVFGAEDQSMSFYIEHVVKTETHSGFAPDGAITVEEFREISAYAADYHIKVINPEVSQRLKK